MRQEGRADLAGVKILIVDDHADTLELWAFALNDCGAEVTTATTVADALAALERRRPSIVVSDVKMKGNGHTIAAKARELGVPAVAVSGGSEVPAPLGQGFTRHLIKPVAPDELCTAIEEVMRSHDA